MSSLGDCIPLFTMEIACTHFHFLQRDMLAFDAFFDEEGRRIFYMLFVVKNQFSIMYTQRKC